MTEPLDDRLQRALDTERQAAQEAQETVKSLGGSGSTLEALVKIEAAKGRLDAATSEVQAEAVSLLDKLIQQKQGGT